jgi:preflagellin peptidase FlaK
MVNALEIIHPSLIPGVLALLITLVYGSWLDIRERQVPKNIWYPALVIGLPGMLWFYLGVFLSAGFFVTALVVVPIALFCLIFYVFTRTNLFGLADAKALILIAFLIPAFPLVPFFGFPPMGPYSFFSFSVLINAVLLNLLVPAGLFVINLKRGSFAPFPYMFLGFPVRSADLPASFGVIIEEITETDEGLQRRFLKVGEAIGGMVRGVDRIYTRDLKDHPEKYKKEMATYTKAEYVWISYGVPFLVPITAGLVVTLLAGDILTILMRLIAGMM